MRTPEVGATLALLHAGIRHLCDEVSPKRKSLFYWTYFYNMKQENGGSLKFVLIQVF
jgi:hypothetical protein